jgi:hypothetical protein
MTIPQQRTRRQRPYSPRTDAYFRLEQSGCRLKNKSGNQTPTLTLPLAGGGNSDPLSLMGEGWGEGDLLPDQLFKD